MMMLSLSISNLLFAREVINFNQIFAHINDLYC